jgi:hypothetical protein
MLLAIPYLYLLRTLFMLVQTTHHYLSKQSHSCLLISQSQFPSLSNSTILTAPSTINISNHVPNNYYLIINRFNSI